MNLMVSIPMKIKIPLVVILIVAAGFSLSAHAYADTYNLGAMSIFVPNQLKVDYRMTDNGKVYDLAFRNGDPFGTIAYTFHDTSPAIFDKSLDYVKEGLSNYQEIKRGCDDNLLSLNTNYCAVKYYGEDSQGNGHYYFQMETQVGNGLSAIWTFLSTDERTINTIIPIAVQIADSMQPHYRTLGTNGFGTGQSDNSNTGQSDNSNTGQSDNSNTGQSDNSNTGTNDMKLEPLKV